MLFLKESPDETFSISFHSFYCEPSDESVVLARLTMECRIASVVAQGNLSGVQFHPEKSQAAGLRLLANFAGTNWTVLAKANHSLSPT